MKNRMTKVAAVALLTFAAAPMAMAYGVLPGADSNAPSVSVQALAPQPDMPYQAVSTADTNDANMQVRVIGLGVQPGQPFSTQQASAGHSVVAPGNLPQDALLRGR